MRRIPAILLAASALLTAQKPASFDAASIRLRPSPDGPFHYNIYPNRLDALNMTMRFLICDAFDLPDFQLTGLDTSHPSRHFDLVASAGAPVSRGDMRLMLQNLVRQGCQSALSVQRDSVGGTHPHGRRWRNSNF
jgi:uncharacterized protein (TIGR03435 family)